MLESASVAAHRLPASELPTGPRRGGDEDKGLGLAFRLVMRLGGQTRADPPGKKPMTSDKARKTAIRQRMAVTGEPYSVARKATEAEPAHSVPDEIPQE